ncbi:MAG: heavy metal translocating P-type ATPase [Pseudomonadales bacterium]|nr:heavy metal translocating P-type ATPase [Pseudomonadales bacterium]MDG1441144.1 heavy metal translocating P-type ATPase [Pseudomonadales bacterium]
MTIAMSKLKQFNVNGMHCKNCVRRVSEAVNKVPGVTETKVDLDNGIVSVAGDADLDLIEAAIIASGYQTDSQSEEPIADAEPVDDLNMESWQDHQFLVSGMSCTACVRNIENALQNLPTVHQVSVNFADESAYVSSTLSASEIIAVFSGLGYGATELSDLSMDEKEALDKQQFSQGLRRSIVAIGVASVLMAGTMSGVLPAISQTAAWLAVALVVLCVTFYSGRHFYVNAIKALRHGSLTMDTLVALGTGTAWTYSTLVLLFPSISKNDYVFYEGGLFVIGFVGLGKALEHYSRMKSAGAIEKLLNLAPDDVTVIESGDEYLRPVDQVKLGDLVRLRPGDSAAVDGIVIEGYSSIDESMLTGEALPVDKVLGDSIVAGTVNQYGSLVMRVEQVGRNTTLARLAAGVRQAQNSKPQIARITDSIAAFFVPAVMLIAVATFVFWFWLAEYASLDLSVTTAMTVLIIACPCAVGLAIPMSIMLGVARGAKQGLLVKNGQVLQEGANIQTVVFDKTGTLTKGELCVSAASTQIDQNQFWTYVSSLERLSEHPIARAVEAHCVALNLSGVDPKGENIRMVTEVELFPGGGIVGTIEGTQIVIGNPAFLARRGISLEGKNDSKILVAFNNHLVGSFGVTDELRPEAKSIVSELQAMNVNVIMMSGDGLTKVEQIAKQLGIEEYYAELLPDQKLAAIKTIQASGQKVAMVGDGINDAMALSIADVGIAIGQGADIAIESADVALVRGGIHEIPAVLTLSKKVMNNIYQNLIGAFAYNVMLIPVAAGVLYPTLIAPAYAGLAMALSSLTVVANASRLKAARL